MKTHNIKQGTPEWHELKKGRFSATNGSAIGNAGKGLATLITEKALDYVFGSEPTVANYYMAKGNECEPIARMLYELEYNSVQEVGFVELNEWVGCSPDGLVGDDGLVEIKWYNRNKFLIYTKEGKIDSSHLWQMQFQMFVTGRQWCDYVVYNDCFDRIIVTRIAKDDEKITKIEAGLVIAIPRLQREIELIQKQLGSGTNHLPKNEGV